jgi:hypothetical protein
MCARLTVLSETPIAAAQHCRQFLAFAEEPAPDADDLVTLVQRAHRAAVSAPGFQLALRRARITNMLPLSL